MGSKIVFIAVAEFDGPVTLKKNAVDDDAEGYMYELFGDATGDYEADINMALVAAADDMTLVRAKELVTGISD